MRVVSNTLAKEMNSDILIMDEAKGRKIAQSLDIEITGTAGILVSSKIRGLIPEVKPLLDSLIKNKIRISDKLYSEVLKKAEE